MPSAMRWIFPTIGAHRECYGELSARSGSSFCGPQVPLSREPPAQGHRAMGIEPWQGERYAGPLATAN
jgi:hypothetical protein